MNFKNEESYNKVIDAQKRGQITRAKKLQEIREKYYMNPVLCSRCGKPISFELRNQSKYCSHSCAAKITNHARDKIIFCKNCGERITKDGAKFFCSYDCQHEYVKKEKIAEWLSGKWNGTSLDGNRLSRFIRAYLLKKHNYKCQICGWSEINQHTNKSPLEVHHVDGNYKNNKENNLLIVCPNCHSLTENFRGRGNGREYRRK